MDSRVTIPPGVVDKMNTKDTVDTQMPNQKTELDAVNLKMS